MGYEYRLHIEPPLADLQETCQPIFKSTNWKQISTSLTEVPGIGVQLGDISPTPSWPHVADLHHEKNGSIYVICHNNDGGEFMNTLIKSLTDTGHRVDIDDDI